MTADRDANSGNQHHGGHSWMMIACCIPMIAIALALVATGAVGPGFLLVAVMCTAMMAFMMRAMGDGGDDQADHDHSAQSEATDWRDHR